MERVLLRNSERSAFKTCRFRWAWTYGGVWDIGPIRSTQPAKALWFGDLVHQALAAYYPPGVKRGVDPVETFLRLYDVRLDSMPARQSTVLKQDNEWLSMRDLGAGMLKGYVEEFSDADQEWEVISSERTFRLPVVVPEFLVPMGESFDLGARRVFPAFRLVVVGTFDGVWRHRSKRSRYAFKEFKTAATIKPDGLAMDDQAGYYFTYGPKWAWRMNIIPKGTYPSEILYTFLRKGIPNLDKTRDAQGRVLNLPKKEDLLANYPTLTMKGLSLASMMEMVAAETGDDPLMVGQPSALQPPPFFERTPVYRDAHERREVHERVIAEAREMMMTRLGVLQPYKNPGPLHMPNCRGCPVRDACELHETGNDFQVMLDATTERWDPYSDHEMVERR